MDKASFNKFVLKAYDHCIPKLQRLTGSKADAEDAFMEALHKFWADLQSGKVKNQKNLRGLVFVMAKNTWLNQKRKGKNKSEYSTDPQELHLHEKKDKDANYDQLVLQEQQAEEAQKKAVQEKLMKKAFGQLEKKCRDILMKFVVKEDSLKELQKSLGYASVNAVKMAKYRCKQKLVKYYKMELKNVTL